ncbi:MAG: PA14 domain-containing protein [Nannocystaceae bacterium]
MIPTKAFLLAALSMVVGCSTNSNNESNNPDAGKVSYDGGEAGADGQGADGASDAGRRRGRDSTSTRGVAGKRKGVQKLAAAKPPREEEADPGTDQGGSDDTAADPHGLVGQVFALEDGTEALPDFDSLSATGTVEVADLNVEARGTFPGVESDAGTVGIRFTGSLNVLKDAEYKLCLNSSAGAVLKLDGAEIVNNDGNHSTANQACEAVFMAPGEYELALDYFYHSTDSITLQLAWGAEGADAEAVPNSAFFKPAS